MRAHTKLTKLRYIGVEPLHSLPSPPLLSRVPLFGVKFVLTETIQIWHWCKLRHHCLKETRCDYILQTSIKMLQTSFHVQPMCFECTKYWCERFGRDWNSTFGFQFSRMMLRIVDIGPLEQVEQSNCGQATYNFQELPNTFIEYQLLPMTSKDFQRIPMDS